MTHNRLKSRDAGEQNTKRPIAQRMLQICTVQCVCARCARHPLHFPWLRETNAVPALWEQLPASQLL